MENGRCRSVDGDQSACTSGLFVKVERCPLEPVILLTQCLHTRPWGATVHNNSPLRSHRGAVNVRGIFTFCHLGRKNGALKSSLNPSNPCRAVTLKLNTTSNLTHRRDPRPLQRVYFLFFSLRITGERSIHAHNSSRLIELDARQWFHLDGIIKIQTSTCSFMRL